MERIKLTPEEEVCYDQIASFNIHSNTFQNSDYHQTMLHCSKLTKSILKRKAIPKHRLDYFYDASYNQGHSNKSKFEEFKRNAGTPEEVYSHQDFLKYLSYFLHGSQLSNEFKLPFQKIRDSTYDSDLSEESRAFLRSYFKREYKQTSSDKKIFAEEVFKFCLDIGLELHNASNVRFRIMDFQINRSR